MSWSAEDRQAMREALGHPTLLARGRRACHHPACTREECVVWVCEGCGKPSGPDGHEECHRGD